MSLDVDLMVMKPTSVYSGNITHNLGAMAREVKYGVECNLEWAAAVDLTLYDVLWRPDEHGYTHAKHISGWLDIGWNILLSDPEKYKKYNPENGWGSYEGLCNVVYQYRNACWNNPEAELSISR
jgi:hypothetical protein